MKDVDQWREEDMEEKSTWIDGDWRRRSESFLRRRRMEIGAMWWRRKGGRKKLKFEEKKRKFSDLNLNLMESIMKTNGLPAHYW